MVVPIAEQALEQVRAAQQRRVDRARAADGDVIAAAGADMAAVEHELLGDEAGGARRVIDRGGSLRQLLPRGGRVDVDLDHAGIGGDREMLQPRIERRRIAFDHHRLGAIGGGILDRRGEGEIILHRLDRRHEDMQQPAAHLDAERGAHDAAIAFAAQRRQRHLLAMLRAAALCQGRRGLARAKGLARRQRRARRGGILGDQERAVRLTRPGQRFQRQAIAHRGIAGQEIERVGAQEPGSALPAPRLAQPDALQRQREAHDLRQALLEDPRQPGALQGIGELALERVDIDRQPPLLPQVVEAVLIARQRRRGVELQALGEPGDEAVRLRRAERGVARLVGGEEPWVAPDRLAVLAPMAAQRPARQLLAGIPLPLAVMQQVAGTKAAGEAPQQLAGIGALRRAERVGVPFRAVGVGCRDEGRLAAHGEAHILGVEIAIDALAQRRQTRPFLFGIRQRDARRLAQPAHRHGVVQHRLGALQRPRDRRRALRLGRAGERDVALAGEQPGGRVEAHPARARQIGLAPSVQIGEIGGRAGGTVERLLVGDELDEIARGEARGDAEMAQQLHQQPGGIAARALGARQRLLRRLHAWLEPDDIADLALQPAVQLDQEIDAAAGEAVDGLEIALQQRARRRGAAEGREFAFERGVVGEGIGLGRGFQKEVEGIDHRHVGDEVDSDDHPVGLLRKDQAGEIVALRILQPVEEMRRRLGLQRIGEDRRARMRCRPQPHRLRPQRDRPVVAVFGTVMERNLDAHDGPSSDRC